MRGSGCRQNFVISWCRREELAPDLTWGYTNLFVQGARERGALCPSFVSNSMRRFAYNTISLGMLSLGIIETPFSSKHQQTKCISLNCAIRRRILIRIIYNFGNSFGKFYTVKQQFAVEFVWLASTIVFKNGIETHRLLFHNIFWDIINNKSKYKHFLFRFIIDIVQTRTWISFLLYRSCFSIRVVLI